MQLPTLLAQVLQKTAPMSAIEQDKINTDATLAYEKAVQKAKDNTAAGTASLIDKIVLHADAWYARALFAIAYFWIIGFIQNLMNPGDSHPDDDMHEVQR